MFFCARPKYRYQNLKCFQWVSYPLASFFERRLGLFVVVNNVAVWVFIIMEKKSETERHHIPLAHG